MPKYLIHLERSTVATLELEVPEGEDPEAAADDAIDEGLADMLDFESFSAPHVISVDGPVS